MLQRLIFPLRDLKNYIEGRFDEVQMYLYDLLFQVDDNQRRIAIFAQGRTGSTVLEDLIASTGYVRAHREVFDRSEAVHPEVFSPLRYIRGLSKKQSPEGFIFHIKVYHLTLRNRPVRPDSFLENLYADGWTIIHLRRRNKVRHALSSLVAEHRGGYLKTDDRDEDITITVDLDRLVEIVEERIEFAEQEDSALSNVDYHDVVYEDNLRDSGDHQATVNDICEYISEESRKADTKYEKINRRTNKELIKNYDEFRQTVHAHGWEDMLEEDRAPSDR